MIHHIVLGLKVATPEAEAVVAHLAILSIIEYEKVRLPKAKELGVSVSPAVSHCRRVLHGRQGLPGCPTLRLSRLALRQMSISDVGTSTLRAGAEEHIHERQPNEGEGKSKPHRDQIKINGRASPPPWLHRSAAKIQSLPPLPSPLKSPHPGRLHLDPRAASPVASPTAR